MRERSAQLREEGDEESEQDAAMANRDQREMNEGSLTRLHAHMRGWRGWTVNLPHLPGRRAPSLPHGAPPDTSGRVTSESSRTAAAKLCTDCGLCCNGVLFDQVILQPGVRPQALAALGLRIKKRTYFNQPCVALCGTRCGVYGHRPERCRRFECRQFQQVASGAITAEAAAARIREAQQQVAVVESLLAAIGGSNPRKPLAQRCATALAELTTPEDAARRAELAGAMEQLQNLLTTHFRLM